MKILFCADGSEFSEYAMEYAGKMFGDCAEATVLYVAPDAKSLYDRYMIVKEDFSEKLVEISKSILGHAAAILEKHKVTPVTKERTGNAAEQIIKEIDSGDYDMVVLGSHGASGLTTFVLGSVSTKVLCSSPIPVLVVKDHRKIKQPE